MILAVKWTTYAVEKQQDFYHFHHRVCYGLLSRALRPAMAELQGSIPGQAWKFLRFFVKPLGCSFYCEDNFHVSQLKLLKDFKKRKTKHGQLLF